MKFFKSILHLITEPIRYFGSRNISDKVVKFFDKHYWLTYVLALLVTIVAVFFKYIYPELIP